MPLLVPEAPGAAWANFGPPVRTYRSAPPSQIGSACQRGRSTVTPVDEAPDSRPPVWTGHVNLRSGDTVAAARFYERIGMRPVQVAEHFSVLEMRGGTHLAIRHDPEHVAPGPAPWDLMVDDLDAIHDKWQAHGLPLSPIKDGPPHRFFEVTDPDGHVLIVRDTHVIGPV
jgi:catechol 2,3-dioxygenase-like lactoylglutathione lyase family enzyme